MNNARRTPKRLLTKTVASYVAERGIEEGPSLEDFLDPRLNALTSPEKMNDRLTIARRLAQAIREKTKIVVFGDYDCDGMTATAILCDAIEALGGTAHAILASRFDGGYGVSKRALTKIQAAEPGLVVTCDCGSSDHATLGVLTEQGIDVIVIDHHLVPDTPLPVFAFLNPHRPECAFPYKGMASCGLVFSVVAALRKELGVSLDLRQWLDLVAIGTVADVAPLTQDNRALVRAGLQTLRNSERAGIRALVNIVGLDRDYPFVASDIGFRIAPRLNAPGRMQDPDLAFQLLRERDPSRAEALAEEVEQLCKTRRVIQAKIEEEAETEIRELNLAEAPALVIGREGWNHGIVGIVAGRLAEKYKRPALVVGFENGVGRGSVRGPAGFPLYDALCACEGHLERFGGHQAAAGMEIKAENLAAFRAAYELACDERKNFEPPLVLPPLDLQPEDDLSDVLADLYLLEPCGEQNPAPSLAINCRVRGSREVRGGHLKLDLELANGRRVGGFGPNLGGKAKELAGEARVVGQLRPDRYRGGDAVELLVTQVDCH